MPCSIEPPPTPRLVPTPNASIGAPASSNSAILNSSMSPLTRMRTSRVPTRLAGRPGRACPPTLHPATRGGVRGPPHRGSESLNLPHTPIPLTAHRRPPPLILRPGHVSTLGREVAHVEAVDRQAVAEHA